MEAEPSPRLPRLQEAVQSLRTVQWLGMLLRSRDQGGDGVSRGNGKNGHGPVDGERGPGGNGDGGGMPPEERAEIARAVKRVLDHADHLAELEAGGSEGRICTPLLAGPQRYRDPSIWGPNYRVRAMAQGLQGTPEEVAELKKVPLGEDPQYLESLDLAFDLTEKLGLPETIDD
jgi:hypothetical protein